MDKLRFAPEQAAIIKETRNVLWGREMGGGMAQKKEVEEEEREGWRQNLSGLI